ncbi:hypothetical protein PHYSODRAFT_304600 [Phytophthora sojae]|uniref:Uncharacterized protein n=1 Tax=Phytophthora sojae (strain P6497) TaxID=1094619 RepID=G5A1S9_PHYSP|nr:hypothetical protein PHYSODRAFT_304600 [Phytophthora sojae]EGZ10877.1 hypothetical protein PHYSODRAFT_304600 [Phytophthora sojae]|eukprot:XP_009533622.1 hypothetical protein PHYSODRAFT_304600 [Phytophthora sojae]
MRVTAPFVVAAGAYAACANALSEENSTQQHLVLAAADEACYWQQDLSCDLEDAANTLRLGVENECDVPIPVPVDNYVEDLRINKYDVPAEGRATQQPFVQISGSNGKLAVATRKATWYKYVTDAASVQSDIRFNGPGMYDMVILANDYNGEASCLGCIAVLDKFRPRYGTAGTCPDASSDAQKVTKPLTQAAFNELKTLETGYQTYTASSNVVNNPNSGGTCYLDEDTAPVKKSFYGREKECDDLSDLCYSSTMLSSNLVSLKTAPFTATSTSLQTAYATLESTLNQQCTWCCRKKSVLREYYTKYYCPADYSPPSSFRTVCAYDNTLPNKCTFNTCIEGKGADIVTASVVVKSTVQTASTNVLNALPKKPDGSDVTKHVYYSIPCTSFSATDTNCRYTAKLSQLLDVRRAFTTTLPTPPTTLDVKDFVFWRYNVNGKSFVRWDPLADTAITFTDPTTTIVLEAWTACGMAYTTTFTVNLYLHSTLACSKFPAMWKVVEKPGVQGSEGTYCAYGGSDFAVLKLDMVVADVLQQSDTTVTGSYTGVTCSMMVKPTGGTDTSVVKVLEDSSAATISKYYGVELVNNPSTAQKTTGVVRCTFTRTPRTNLLALALEAVGTDANSIECSHTFTITDCDKPHFLLGNDVCANKCAGDASPGMYEACGGSIVTSTSTDTLLKPSTTPTCCTKCSQALACNAVGSTDVKRCEPPWTPVLLTEATDLEPFDATIAVLVGASAAVAVAVLSVFKHRAHVGAPQPDDSQGGYYTLID